MAIMVQGSLQGCADKSSESKRNQQYFVETFDPTNMFLIVVVIIIIIIGSLEIDEKSTREFKLISKETKCQGTETSMLSREIPREIYN